VTNGSTVCLLVYDEPGELLGETYSGGPLNGLAVTNFYDSLLRRSTNGLWNGSTWLTQTRYRYDLASRLLSVGDGTNSAAYTYVANSRLVSQILFTNNATLRMTTTKSYDYLNRLTAIQSSTGGSPVASFSYGNNSANQRTSVTNVDSSYWVYQYDNLGQVTSGKKYWSDGIPVAGQQFTYNFDDIGNRQTTAFGGDQNGANLRPANYTNNSLNQITGRDVPGYVNILGEATNTAAVYVNNQVPYRRTNYFREELSLDNSGGPIWLGVTNLAVLSSGSSSDIVSTNVGNLFLPKTAEMFAYDADGNLTNDGRWVYMWDAENRLINMTSQSAAPVGSKVRLDFLYDYQGRRIQKLVSTNSGSAYVAEYTNRFAYDGWNLIAILNPQSSILQSFEWGLDLSGSTRGAGGIGALLILNDAQTIDNQPSSHLVSFDGSGNVSALINATNGLTSANYAYGPFGEVIRSTGPMAKASPLRFSSKYQDDETEALYYGYRYYNTGTGRWLSRDPIEEEGGISLYVLGSNDLVNKIDGLGLAWYEQIYVYDDKSLISAYTYDRASVKGFDTGWQDDSSKLNTAVLNLGIGAASSVAVEMGAGLLGITVSGTGAAAVGGGINVVTGTCKPQVRVFGKMVTARRWYGRVGMFLWHVDWIQYVKSGSSEVVPMYIKVQQRIVCCNGPVKTFDPFYVPPYSSDSENLPNDPFPLHNVGVELVQANQSTRGANRIQRWSSFSATNAF